MELDNKKLIFFSAIFVVFVAVAVTVGKAAFIPATTSGTMSPSQLWNAIEKGRIENNTYHTIEGVIESVDTVYAGTIPLYNIIYFKGCDAPFLWGIHDKAPTDYINKRVTVVVCVAYLGEMAQGYGKDGWVALIGDLVE